MPRGGVRPRAGRKSKGELTQKSRTFRCTDAEWAEIQRRAEKANMNASEYIRSKALGEKD